MKTIFVISLLLLTNNTQAHDLLPVSFLKGCWGMVEHKSQIMEDWFKESTNVMIGVSRSMNEKGRTEGHEFLTIKWDDAKKALTYQGILNGRPLALFTYNPSLSKAGAKAVFLNPENEFPQFISYQLKNANSMEVILKGKDGNNQDIEFNHVLTRHECANRF